jgi:arginine exporter protein ArgO
MKDPLSEAVQGLRELTSERSDYDPDDFQVLRQGYIDLMRSSPSIGKAVLPIVAACFISSCALLYYGVAAFIRTRWIKDPALWLGLAFTMISGIMLYGHTAEQLRSKRVNPKRRLEVLRSLVKDGLISEAEAKSVME